MYDLVYTTSPSHPESTIDYGPEQTYWPNSTTQRPFRSAVVGSTSIRRLCPAPRPAVRLVVHPVGQVHRTGHDRRADAVPRAACSPVSITPTTTA